MRHSRILQAGKRSWVACACVQRSVTTVCGALCAASVDTCGTAAWRAPRSRVGIRFARDLRSGMQALSQQASAGLTLPCAAWRPICSLLLCTAELASAHVSWCGVHEGYVLCTRPAAQSPRQGPGPWRHARTHEAACQDLCAGGHDISHHVCMTERMSTPV